jgi:metal-responsive CopG/Arc/MetJ family transcriptional regulator
MKTAISLPDELGSVVEDFIQKAQLSRSEFFQLAAREYLTKHASLAITNGLNKVYSKETHHDDIIFLRAAATHLGEISKDTEW